MSQLKQYGRTQGPASLTFKDMVAQAFYNCVNSNQGTEADSFGHGDIQRFTSHVAFDRFPENVEILSDLILEEWKDAPYTLAIADETIVYNKNRVVCDHSMLYHGGKIPESCTESYQEKEVTVKGPHARFKAISELLERRHFWKEYAITAEM